jgi:hypothetical protein
MVTRSDSRLLLWWWWICALHNSKQFLQQLNSLWLLRESPYMWWMSGVVIETFFWDNLCCSFCVWHQIHLAKHHGGIVNTPAFYFGNSKFESWLSWQVSLWFSSILSCNIWTVLSNRPFTFHFIIHNHCAVWCYIIYDALEQPTPWCRILEKLLSWWRNSLPLMEPEVSLPTSQELTTGPILSHMNQVYTLMSYFFNSLRPSGKYMSHLLQQSITLVLYLWVLYYSQCKWRLYP